MVTRTGYSAFSVFSTIANCCEKTFVLETSQSQNAIAHFGLLRRTLRVLIPNQNIKKQPLQMKELFFMVTRTGFEPVLPP